MLAVARISNERFNSTAALFGVTCPTMSSFQTAAAIVAAVGPDDPPSTIASSESVDWVEGLTAILVHELIEETADRGRSSICGILYKLIEKISD